MNIPHPHPPPGVAQKPHTQHTSLPVTSRTPNQSVLATIIWYRSSKSVTESRVKLRELWHYFTSKNNCLFPWNQDGINTQREVKAHHDLSMPIRKLNWKNWSIDRVLTVSPTSEMHPEPGEKSTNVYFRLLGNYRIVYIGNWLRKLLLLHSWSNTYFVCCFLRPENSITCHHHRSEMLGTPGAVPVAVSGSILTWLSEGRLISIATNNMPVFQGTFTIWYGIICTMALNIVKNEMICWLKLIWDFPFVALCKTYWGPFLVSLIIMYPDVQNKQNINNDTQR